MVRWSFLIALLALGNVSRRRIRRPSQRTTTLTALFPPDKAKALADTLPPDKPLRYRVRIPQAAASSGVLVFVKPIDSGELPAGLGRGTRSPESHLDRG